LSSLLALKVLCLEVLTLEGILDGTGTPFAMFLVDDDLAGLEVLPSETISLNDVVDWLGLNVFFRAFLKGAFLSCFSP